MCFGWLQNVGLSRFHKCFIKYNMTRDNYFTEIVICSNHVIEIRITHDSALLVLFCQRYSGSGYGTRYWSRCRGSRCGHVF